MQSGVVFLDGVVVNIDFPCPEAEVIPGVLWGAIEAFPSPAYWAYQIYARRLKGITVNYKLGDTLKEEVGACLLGGHGIPAVVGVAAFNHLKHHGAFDGAPPSEELLLYWLKQPLLVNGRSTRYRFAKQKSHYLAEALWVISHESAPVSSGRALRDWLLKIHGVGYKTASWIARNWLGADDVAILDIHILRAGLLGNFLDKNLTVQRHYSVLEDQFLRFSAGLGVRASELDALIWLEMMASQRIVRRLMPSLHPQRR